MKSVRNSIEFDAKVLDSYSVLGDSILNYTIQVSTMKDLTNRQQAILEFLSEFSRKRGFSPSLREIGEAVGLKNVSAVRGHVSALERKGYIQKEPDQPRSITVMRQPSIMSRIKRKLHEFARTDEGVIHRVRYGVVLATEGLKPVLGPATREALGEAISYLKAEHDWKFVAVKYQADHLVAVVEVWPNHSPELVARRIAGAVENSLKRGMASVTGHVWARGYAVTTDPEELDAMVEQFLESSR